MLKKFYGTLVMLGECVRMSLSNIFSNRARSFLTVLGILIGVTAVIALITTVNGFSGSLSSSFSSMGAGSLTITVTGSDQKVGLTVADLDELSEIEQLRGVSPSVSLRAASASRSGKYEEDLTVSGRNAHYFTETEDAILRGRAINILDERDNTFVCLISQELMETLFYGVDPLGETVFIKGMPFTVIGVLDDDASSSITSMMSGSDDIIIPYTTAMKMNNTNVVTSITAYIEDGLDSEEATETLEAKLDELFNYEDDCYSIMDMSSIEDTMNSMLSMVSYLLAGIASIALLVGGIGIMNMMLTTVTERTTEIGLKKALGAIPWQIQAQFLIESFLLSVIGGVLGIALGLLLSWAMCLLIGMDFVISSGAITLGAGFSAAVGILFGWAPSRKASRLNPIDALRSI